MEQYQIFLSIVYVLRNQSDQLEHILRDAIEKLSPLVSDYELIIIDNASDDDSLSVLKELTGEKGLPNLQVYALTKEVDADTAFWVGLENSLGDSVAVVDPLTEDIGFLPKMLDAASSYDVVFANNLKKPPQSFTFRVAHTLFSYFYKYTSGVHLAKEMPQYRVLSRQVVNFILQHPQPAITYRHLPATGGWRRINMEYSAEPRPNKLRKQASKSFDKGMRLLVSTTRAPMRIVTVLSLFGAVSNALYSIYVVSIAFLKTDTAPGWVSLSLQQSGMFFLISLVLFVLGEYILHMASLSNEGPPYHISHEFTSAQMTNKNKLNIEKTDA